MGRGRDADEMSIEGNDLQDKEKPHEDDGDSVRTNKVGYVGKEGRGKMMKVTTSKKCTVKEKKAQTETTCRKQANCEAVAIIAKKVKSAIDFARAQDLKIKKLKVEMDKMKKEAANFQEYTAAWQGKLRDSRACVEGDSAYDAARMKTMPHLEVQAQKRS